MTTFDDRNKAFENKYAHDKEIDFKVQARTTKLLALWAAGLLGMTEADATHYATQMVETNLEKTGIEDVVKRIAMDFHAKDVRMTDRDIRDELERKQTLAREQLMSGT